MEEPRHSESYEDVAEGDFEGVAAAPGSSTDYVSRIPARAHEATGAVNGDEASPGFDDTVILPSVPMATDAVRNDMVSSKALTTHPAEAAIPAQIAGIADSAAQRVSILDRRHVLTDVQRSEMFFSYAHEFAQRQGVLAAAGATTDPVSGPSSDPSTPYPSDSSSDMDETVYELLTEEQQEEYVDAALDRDLWWTEVVGILAADIGSVPDRKAASINGDAPVSAAASSSTADEAPAAEGVNSHPGGNLFDLLNP